jgi:hypothetical protein
MGGIRGDGTNPSGELLTKHTLKFVSHRTVTFVAIVSRNDSLTSQRIHGSIPSLPFTFAADRKMHDSNKRATNV